MNKITSCIILPLMCIMACDHSSGTEEKSAVSFQVMPESTNPNFITFIADGDGAYDTFEWSFSQENQPLKGKSITRYFERKGTYEVVLTQKNGSQKGTANKTITISEDSYYYRQGEQLWWNDEFSGTKLDNTAWNYDTGVGKWGNNEWQNYTDKSENSFLRDGKLILKALKTGEGQKIGDYTSARLTTRGKKEINRGRVEVRAKLPEGVGLWSAIWLFGTKAQPYYSELDILEYVGCDKNIIYGAVHTSETLASTEKVSSSRVVEDVEQEFHVYGMNWTDGKIEFYLDAPSNVYLSFNPADKSNPRIWPFDRELYLILNIAVGGDWGGMRGVDDSVFPKEMEIDYVRIFKKQ